MATIMRPTRARVLDDDDDVVQREIRLEGAKGYRILSVEEGRVQFDAAARRIMGIGGDEFIRRWEAGEYDAIADTDGHRHIMDLAGLIEFGRSDD